MSDKENILAVTTRSGFRKWLDENHDKASDCWLLIRRGKTPPEDCVWYLDAGEEANASAG